VESAIKLPVGGSSKALAITFRCSRQLSTSCRASCRAGHCRSAGRWLRHALERTSVPRGPALKSIAAWLAAGRWRPTSFSTVASGGSRRHAGAWARCSQRRVPASPVLAFIQPRPSRSRGTSTPSSSAARCTSSATFATISTRRDAGSDEMSDRVRGSLSDVWNDRIDVDSLRDPLNFWIKGC
jgi:hypothetical protein